MPTLRQVHRLFIRAALIWALIGAVLMLVRAVSEVVDLPIGAQTSEAVIAAVILGFFGNLWVSSIYSLSSSLPSSKPIPLKSASYIFPLWQIGVVAAAASHVEIYRQLPGFGYPVLALTVVAGYATFVTLESMRSRTTDASAAHWANLVACVEFLFGTLLATLGAVNVVSSTLGQVGVAFVALGWSNHAALVLFVRAFELEPYDDQRPVYVAFGAALAMVVVVFLGPGATILMSLAQLAYVLALAFLLQKRWFGKFVSWEERFLMAGVVAGFFGLSGLPGSSFGSLDGYSVALGISEGISEGMGQPYPLLAWGVLIVPLAFGAAYVAKERSNTLRKGMCRTIIAAVIAAALPQFVLSLFYLDPFEQYRIVYVRALFGAAEIVVAAGLGMLASLTRGIKRYRADLRPV